MIKRNTIDPTIEFKDEREFEVAKPPTREVPLGGEVGQVLTKQATGYGWADSGETGSSSVHYTADTGKSENEKAQARTNIDAQKTIENLETIRTGAQNGTEAKEAIANMDTTNTVASGYSIASITQTDGKISITTRPTGSDIPVIPQSKVENLTTDLNTIRNNITANTTSINTVETNLGIETDRAKTVEQGLKTRIDNLDYGLSSSTGDGQTTSGSFISAVVQTNGQLSANIRTLNRTDFKTDFFAEHQVEELPEHLTTLQTNIDTEAATREDVDTALTKRIDRLNYELTTEIGDGSTKSSEFISYIKQDKGQVSSNKRTLVRNDFKTDFFAEHQVEGLPEHLTTLQTNIDTEAATREAADTAEVKTRKDADTELNNRIDALDYSHTIVAHQFVTNVSQEDGQLGATFAQPIIADVNGLQGSLDTLQANINTEAEMRANADTALGTRIDALNLETVTATQGKIINTISQTKGQVAATTRDLVEDDIPALHLTKITDVTATKDEVNKLDGVVDTVSATQFNQLSGIDTTQTIQTQLDNKELLDATILKQKDVVDNVISTTTIYPLSANQGKVLNDRITSLEGLGRFLSLWDCTAGLPETDPTTLPYTYHAGDYYRVSKVAPEYLHTITLTCANTYGTTTVVAKILNNSNTEFTTQTFQTWLFDNGYFTIITGPKYWKWYNATVTCTDGTVLPQSIMAPSSRQYECFILGNNQKYKQVDFTNVTTVDTVTDALNYKPYGATYTGEASTTVETATDIQVGDNYFYDGTSWILQYNHISGLVTDVKVDDVSTVTGSTSNITLSNFGVTANKDEINTLDGITASTSELNILDGATLTTAELNYVDGVTSSIQTQLDTNSTAISTEASRATTVETELINRGHYLGKWNCGTGLPVSLTSGYTYKAGDWFKIDNAGLYNHSIHITSYYASGIYKANVTVNVKNSDSPEMGRGELATWLYNNSHRDYATGYTSISGSVSISSTSCTVQNIYSESTIGNNMAIGCIRSGSATSFTLVTDTGATTFTDTVTTICYAPSGSSYAGVASTVVETRAILEGDIYYYDGTDWILDFTHSPVTDVQVNGTSVLNKNTANITLNNFGVTATSNEINVLDGITATTAELNYTDGVTSNIQTQLDTLDENKQDDLKDLSTFANNKYLHSNRTTGDLEWTDPLPTQSALTSGQFLKSGDGSEEHPAAWEAITLPVDMVGATATTAGVHGLVPAPAAGDQYKFLRGDATWGEMMASNTASVSVQIVSGTLQYVANHGLNTKNVSVQIYDTTTFETLVADVTRSSMNEVTIDFNTLPAHNIMVLCTGMTAAAIPSGEEVYY